MLNKKNIPATILASFIGISPEIAMATEDSMTSFLPPIWPFLAFVLFVIIFRKQLNCVPPFEPEEDEKPVSIDQEQVPPEPEIATATDTDTTTEVINNIIDLKDNRQQCQASTAKGTRCKRKTTLENTSISIDDKTYLLTVCRQHNTDHLKPFPEFIK